jgi:hypothetical protein
VSNEIKEPFLKEKKTHKRKNGILLFILTSSLFNFTILVSDERLTHIEKKNSTGYTKRKITNRYVQNNNTKKENRRKQKTI